MQRRDFSRHLAGVGLGLAVAGRAGAQSAPVEGTHYVKLSTLAAYFRTTTTPNHRALADARATVDVLHGLLERIGNLGAGTLEDLVEFTRRVSPERRAKRSKGRWRPRSRCKSVSDSRYGGCVGRGSANRGGGRCHGWTDAACGDRVEISIAQGAANSVARNPRGVADADDAIGIVRIRTIVGLV